METAFSVPRCRAIYAVSLSSYFHKQIMIVAVMVASHSTNATTILLLIKWVQVSPAAVDRFFVSELLSCAHKAISTQRMSSLTARETNQSGEPSYLQYRIGTSTRERDSWRRIAVSHGISRCAEDRTTRSSGDDGVAIIAARSRASQRGPPRWAARRDFYHPSRQRQGPTKATARSKCGHPIHLP